MIKIMVVEDDAAIRSTIREYLKTAGYQVYEAGNGEEALSMYGKIYPDLILLDIMLPGYSGMELLKMIRVFDKDTLIIMLTALSDETTQLTAFENQVDDYITKPFSVNVLVKKIESLLKRAGRIGSAMLEYEHLSLDVEGYKAYWDDAKALELTATEFDLLKTLIQNRGRVMSRTQLLDKVWGYDYIGDERIVDAHIKNLRHKLPENIIVTAKGIGYSVK